MKKLVWSTVGEECTKRSWVVTELHIIRLKPHYVRQFFLGVSREVAMKRFEEWVQGLMKKEEFAEREWEATIESIQFSASGETFVFDMTKLVPTCTNLECAERCP